MIRPSFAFTAFIVLILTTLSHYAAALGCYEERPSLRPAVFAACLRVINLIPAIHGNPQEPLKFSEDPTARPDIRLPTYWRDSNSNCVIGLLLAPGEQGSDRSSLADLKDWAGAVATQ
ncbi:MAG: hypothetical protein Q9225_003970 [Loekoesia sp. 1 TL-2023]